MIENKQQYGKPKHINTYIKCNRLDTDKKVNNDRLDIKVINFQVCALYNIFNSK